MFNDDDQVKSGIEKKWSIPCLSSFLLHFLSIQQKKCIKKYVEIFFLKTFVCDMGIWDGMLFFCSAPFDAMHARQLRRENIELLFSLVFSWSDLIVKLELSKKCLMGYLCYFSFKTLFQIHELSLSLCQFVSASLPCLLVLPILQIFYFSF